MLPESGINTEKVQFAGISRWDIPQQTLRLKGLQGGWFTTPDQVVRKNFSKRYEALYKKKPHGQSEGNTWGTLVSRSPGRAPPLLFHKRS